jgi:hypothetical protein
MKSLLLAAAVLAGAAAGPAAAAEVGSDRWWAYCDCPTAENFGVRVPPSMTLYEAPNYKGRSHKFSGALPDLAMIGFLAQSARASGRWKVCEGPGLSGDCVEVSRNLRDLAKIPAVAAIASMEPVRAKPAERRHVALAQRRDFR